MIRSSAYHAAILAVLLPVGAAAQDDDDGTFLERLLERNLSGEGIDVRVIGFRGALSSEATLDRLTVADDDGIWLTLEDVVLDWNRGALLRGRFSVDTLRAGSIALERLPGGGGAEDDLPAPESSGFSLPELPVSVNIGEIVSPAISIGAPVFGVAAEFSLEGSVSLADGEGETVLDIVRTDGQEGELRLDAGYSNATNVLDISLVLNEAADGILATVAGLPGQPSVDLTVDGEGPLDTFAATLSFATDGVERLGGDVSIGATGDTPAEDGTLPFAATLAGDVAPLFLPAYAEFFGPRIALDLSGLRQADGALDFERFRLTAQAIDLDGALSLGPTGLPVAFQLEGAIAAEDGQPVLLPIPGDPTRVGRIDLVAGFDAADGERWTADLTVAGLDRPGFSAESLELDGTGTIPAPGTPADAQVFTADLDFAARALDLGDPAAEEALGEAVTGRLSLSRTGSQPLEISELSIDGETYGAEASGTLDIADRDLTIDGRLSLNARDLSEFAGLARRPLDGSAELDIEGRGALLGGDLAVRLSGQTRDLVVGIPEADRLLAGQSELSLAASRGPNGIEIEDLSVATPAVTAKASGAIRSDRTQVQVSGRLADGALILPGLDGPLELTAEVAQAEVLWTVVADVAGPALTGSADARFELGADAPVFDGTVALSTPSLAPFADLAGLPRLAGAVDATVEGRAAADLSAFDLVVSADARGLTTGLSEIDAAHGGRVRIEADAARDGTVLRIDRLRAETATAEAIGAGRIDNLRGPLVPPDIEGLFVEPTARFDGTVSVTSRDLSTLATLSGRDGLAGRLGLTLTGSLAADLSDFDLDIDVEGGGLVTGIAAVDPLLAGGLSASLEAARPEGGAVTIEGLRAATDTLDATVTGTVTGLPRALLPDTAAILAADPAPVFAGALRLGDTDLSEFAGIASLPGLSGILTSTAEGRVAFDLSEAEIALSARGQGLATGIAAADGYLGGRTTLDLDAALSEGTVTLRRAQVATPALTVDGDGSFGEDGGRVDADIVLADVGRVVPGLSGPLRVDASASSATGDRWSVDADATGPAGLTLAADGDVAGDGSDLDIEVTGSAPLALANQFITPRSVEGEARFDLRVDGPPALASVAGDVTIAGARFVAPTLNLVLEDLRGTIGLNGSRATIDLAAATQGGGGVTVSGPVGLSPPFPADIRLDLQNARFSDPQLFETTLRGQVALSGPLTGGANITGDVALGATEVRVPAGATGGTAPIPDIVHIREPADSLATRRRAGLLDVGDANGGGGPGFGLDVVIRAPEQIFIRGRGLDAELGGQIRIRGTTNEVIPAGQFSLLRGRLDILGKRLTLEEGAFTLEGSLDPFIRLVAEADAGDYDVFVIVVGPASEPQIQFRSEPELPEDEVVARLLFDRGIQNLSPLQAAQLASAVATLTGRGGEGLLGGIREGFGLDDLDVTSDGDGNVGVRAGKYLSENVYTDLVVNSDGTTEIELNLDITPSLTVTGSADNNGDTGIGIFFERDY